MTICIHDESASGESLHELSISFLSERITIRELIRERVHHEVREYNRRESEAAFQGLVQPAALENALNGRRSEFYLNKQLPIDWEVQYARAIEGFEHNNFFIIIDETQAESLDQEFVIAPNTNVSFVKLVPLIGG